MIITEHDKKYEHEDLLYLWKTDDPEWAGKRKEQWKKLCENNFGDSTAAERKLYSRYFLLGEKDQYISGSTLLLLTPYSSGDEANKVFNSKLIDGQQQQNVLGSYIFFAADMARGLPWMKSHIQHFSRGVLGKEYQSISVGVIEISPTPGIWCGHFLGHALRFFDSENDYHGACEAVDYFLSALPYAKKPKHRQRMESRFETLFAAAESCLSGNISEDKRSFAQSLLSKRDDIMKAWQAGAE